MQAKVVFVIWLAIFPLITVLILLLEEILALLPLLMSRPVNATVIYQPSKSYKYDQC